MQAIANALVQAPVAHAEETGIRVGGTRHWLHVLGTAQLTAYFSHPKRNTGARVDLDTLHGVQHPLSLYDRLLPSHSQSMELH